MRETFIVGVGMSPFGRFPETPLGELAAGAAAEALADANAAPSEAGAIVFANATQGALEGQHGIRGQAALDGAGFGNAPVFNVENACASASTALNLAHVLVGSETHDCVLAIGAEKMVMPDPAQEHGCFRGKLGPLPATADHRRTPRDGTRDGAAGREPKRTSRTACSWTSTQPFAGTTWRSSARHSGRWRRSAPRTISIPSTTRVRNTAGVFRSRRCSPLVRSSGR